MGRNKIRNQEGYIACSVCERTFKLLDEKHQHIFSYVNEDLEDAINDAMNDMSRTDWDKLTNEPFYKHLDSEEMMCPNARCKVCDEKDKSYDIFKTRQQHCYHDICYHKPKDQMLGKTGYSVAIKKEVDRLCKQKLIEMRKFAQEGNRLKYPKIELIITEYDDGRKDDFMEKETKEKKEMIEKQKEEIKINKRKKEHDKINNELAKLIKQNNIDMGLKIV